MITVSWTTSWEQKMVIFLVERRKRFFGQMDAKCMQRKWNHVPVVWCCPSLPFRILSHPVFVSFRHRFFNFVVPELGMYILAVGHYLNAWICVSRSIFSFPRFHLGFGKGAMDEAYLNQDRWLQRTFIAFKRATALLNSPANTLYIIFMAQWMCHCKCLCVCLFRCGRISNCRPKNVETHTQKHIEIGFDPACRTNANAIECEGKRSKKKHELTHNLFQLNSTKMA